MVEQPTDDVVKVSLGLRREASHGRQPVAPDLRAIVCRTCAATSSAVK